jgi:hypothetical protein
MLCIELKKPLNRHQGFEPTRKYRKPIEQTEFGNLWGISFYVKNFRAIQGNIGREQKYIFFALRF